jgi:hypothetical protein
MYSELLTALISGAEPDEYPATQGELIEILLQCRHRLNHRTMDHEHLIAEELALELDHDRTLLWLCAAMAIDHDPARFVNPMSERRRLEEVLQRHGLDFDALDEEQVHRARSS